MSFEMVCRCEVCQKTHGVDPTPDLPNEWLAVVWKGSGEYHFCSTVCLYNWVHAKVSEKAA